MYFKVNKTGINERKGLVEIRYDLYLDPQDDRYSEHHVLVPVIPSGGYSGKVDELGQPVNLADYDQWLSGLPKVWQDNPFCCHFMQFEPTITDLEIIEAGDKFLKMAYGNWQKGNLHLNKNEPVQFIDHLIYKEIAKPLVEMEKEIKEKDIVLDFDGDAVGMLVDAVVPKGVDKELVSSISKSAVDKIKVSVKRVDEALGTDFEALKVK